MSTGRVYVVHAAMQAVDSDFMVVPTNGRFSVNQKWHDLLPAAAPVLRPTEWRIGAALPAPMPRGSSRPEIWFIDSTRHQGESPESVIDKICRRIESITARDRRIQATTTPSFRMSHLTTTVTRTSPCPDVS